MPRIRSIHPDICIDKKLARLDNARAERTFMRLWTYCDDDGRCFDDARLIKAAIYPLLDAMTPEVVEQDIAVLAHEGFIARYCVGSEAYLHVPSFMKWQKPNRKVDSRLPPPPSSAKKVRRTAKQEQRSESAVSPHVHAPSVVVVGEGVVDGEGEGALAPQAVPKRATQLPDDFSVSDAMQAWAIEKGIRSNLLGETEKFKNHWKSEGKPKKDWVAAWRNWLIRADEWGSNGRAQRNGNSGAEQVLEEIRRETA